MGAVKERIDAIALPEELLSQKAMIEDIYVRLGNYQKEMKDLPSLKERYVISRAESENLLLELIGL